MSRPRHSSVARGALALALALSALMLAAPASTAAAIVSVSPGVGPTSGGTSVSITGTGFVEGATTVSFGGTRATSVSVDSATHLIAVAPAHAAGTVEVVVAVDGTTATAQAAFTYRNPPLITRLAPAGGTPAGGTRVTLLGSDFADGSVVMFGSNPATVEALTPTSITVVAPAGSEGQVPVIVDGAFGSTTKFGAYTYSTSQPFIGLVSPAFGSPAGGDTVTITGTNLTPGIVVKFGNTAATDVAVAASGNALVATTPAHIVGSVDVSISGGANTVTAQDAFTYRQTARILTVSPALGATGGGTVVTITGSSFTGATAVRFGEVNAPLFRVFSDSQIGVVAPPSAIADAVRITVVTPSGTGYRAKAFTYGSVPEVTFVSPKSGAVAGGTTVSIGGSNLRGATAVYFGGKPARSFSVRSDSLIRAVAPAGIKETTVPIKVVTSAGDAELSEAYLYRNRVVCKARTLGNITFDYRAITLSEAGMQTLASYAAAIQKSSCTTVTIYRFTVKTPPGASDKVVAMVDLSNSRANAVQSQLQSLLPTVPLVVKFAKLVGQVDVKPDDVLDSHAFNRSLRLVLSK